MADVNVAHDLEIEEETLARRRDSHLVHQLAAVVLILGLVTGLLQIVNIGHVRGGPIGALIMGPVMLILWHRGFERAATRFFVYALMASIVVGAYTSSGILGSSWVGIPLVIMTAGWLMGPRHAWLMCLFAILAIFGAYALHDSGYPFLKSSPATSAVSFIFAALVSALIGSTAVASFKDQIDRAIALHHQLRKQNLNLEEAVAQRTDELKNALSNLKTAQHQLIEQEKLAALGILVAGLSHELNTPIGNIVTTASTLQGHLAEANAGLAEGNLKKSTLQLTLARGEEMSRLIWRSGERAALLIENFKQVAASQVSEQRCEFNLREAVASIVESQARGFTDASIEITIRIGDDITLESFQGAVKQILTSVLENSVAHAFPQGGPGAVSVSATVQGEMVCIVVDDNGVGMSPEVAAHIFDPFFTTGMAKGKSGLGLAIAKRIANAVLGGDLTVTSERHRGCRLVLTLPRIGPGQNLATIAEMSDVFGPGPGATSEG